MGRCGWDVKVHVLFLLIGLEVDLAECGDRYSEVQKYQVVDVTVTSPFQGPPIVQAAKEACPSERFIWCVDPYANAIINKPFKE